MSSVRLTFSSSKKILDCGDEFPRFCGQYWWTSVLVRKEGAAASSYPVHLNLADKNRMVDISRIWPLAWTAQSVVLDRKVSKNL